MNGDFCDHHEDEGKCDKIFVSSLRYCTFFLKNDIQDVHLGKISNELKQYAMLLAHIGRTSTRESAGTVEDWLSNQLGVQFGKELKNELASLVDTSSYVNMHTDIFDVEFETTFVVQKWETFLKESKAIIYEIESEIYNQLYRDALSMWREYTLPEQPYMEDPNAKFKGEFRKSWEHVKCEFKGYRDYCCCSDDANDCWGKSQTGACTIREGVHFFGDAQ